MRQSVALDVGGTKLAAARVDEAGAILRRARRATPATTDAEELWSVVAGLLDDVRAGDEVVAGVGCGGPMARDGSTVSPLHIPAWRAFPLAARVSAAVGAPAFVDNDAKALARAEGWRGAARGAPAWLGMVVSTGVGGGIVLDGRLLAGNAGHVGHVIVNPGGRACRCGGRGCLEAEVSGVAIAEITGAPPAEAPRDVRVAAGTLVGRAVASVCSLLDLRLAVVGGSVALGWGAPFFHAAQAELTARARLSFSRDAAIGTDGPLIGAAAVGWSGLGVA